MSKTKILIPDFLDKIDWSLLKKQKNSLLEVVNNDAISNEHKESLEGILSIIDSVQDFAVDIMGIEETTVFGDTDMNVHPEPEIIGFQVVDETDKLHPRMKSANAVYNLKDANSMMLDRGKWDLVFVAVGDIINPEIMFEGDVWNIDIENEE